MMLSLFYFEMIGISLDPPNCRMNWNLYPNNFTDVDNNGGKWGFIDASGW